MTIFIYTLLHLLLFCTTNFKKYAANFHLFHYQKWEIPIFQMSKRFYFLSPDKSIKLYHYLPGLLLSAAPERGRDWGRCTCGRKESRGTQLTSKSEFPVMPRCSHWQRRLYIQLNSGYWSFQTWCKMRV